MKGIQRLERVIADHPGMDVVMITGYGTLGTKGIIFGSNEYVKKDKD